MIEPPSLAPVIFFGLFTAVAASRPDPPTNVSPPDGAAGVPSDATVCAEVSDPDLDTLTARFFGRELTTEPAETFQLIVIPDTQFYAQTYPDIFHSQTSWIVAERAARNIAFVTHVGDIVHLASSQVEWDIADAAMSRLEDPATTELDEGIPYGVAVGNHDQFPNNNAGTIEDPGATTELFNQTFGVSRFEGRSYYGGYWGDNNDNSYQLFSAGGMDFIVVHLEMYDRNNVPNDLQQTVFEWVDALLETHADRRAIITSHHLLCETNGCPPCGVDPPYSAMGQLVYDSFKNKPNLFLMPNGHGGASDCMPRRADTFEGNTVHTMMSNYTWYENCPSFCGNGFLKIMTFEPALDRISVQTYSPWLDEYKTNEYSEFTVDYDMNSGLHFREIGSVQDVQSGLSPCISWSGLASGAEYEWYVEVSDGVETTTGPRWRFTSDGFCSLADDCEDGDPCTIDQCQAGSCTHDPIPNCCVDATDCNDGIWCTTDSCISGSCEHSDNTKPCDDGDRCTENDACTEGACAGSSIECNDFNGCTQDSCMDGVCESTYVPSAGCCVLDDHCEDDNPCTVDSCVVSSDCENVQISGCCLDSAECSDGDTCTVDICTPRNRGAALLDSPYDHVTMFRPGQGTGGEYPGLNTSTFTLECWFKWTGGGIPVATYGAPWSHDPGGIDAFPLIAKGIADAEAHPDNPWLDGKTSVNYFLGIDELSHVLAADFEEHQDGPQPHMNHPVLGSTVIDTGVWHHAAVTYDGTCWRLYLDGQPETDGTNCPGVRPADESMHFFAVGAGQGWAGIIQGSFEGMIDEVRVWNRGLSQAEIQAKMHSQIRFHPELLGRWSFDEAGLAEDTTGNLNVGVFVGAGVETLDIPDLGGSDCAFRTPVEVTDLILKPAISCQFLNCDLPPTSTNLGWSEPPPVGLSYDIASGLVGDLSTDGGTNLAECLANDSVDPVYRDFRPAPPAGQAFYYMLREQGACDAGTYGSGSGGGERLPQAACP